MAEENLSKGQKAYLKRVVNEFKSDADNALKEIEKLKNDLIKGVDEEDSLIEQFSNAEKEIAKQKDKINNLHNEIFVSKIPGQKSLSQSIEGFTEDFKKNKKEIEAIQDEILEFKGELFGSKNSQGKIEDGLKQKMDFQDEQFVKLYDKNKEKQETLLNEIEKLLKGASTVALAKAFKEHKDSYKINNYLWMVLFITAIASMMGISVYIFTEANFEIKEMWKGTVGNIPFIGGAIWLAIYASKQRSQNKRLQEEYAFKEDVAKIYYGLKKEVEELDNTELGKNLKDKIMHILVDTVGLNPSETLDSKSHNDKGPILEAIKNLKSTIKS